MKKEGNEHQKCSRFTEAIEQYAKELGVMQVTAICADNFTHAQEDDEQSRFKAILYTNVGLCYYAMDEQEKAIKYFGDAQGLSYTKGAYWFDKVGNIVYANDFNDEELFEDEYDY